MAFEDSLIGTNDFDPVAAQEELLRQQMGPLPPVLEPRDLNTRLLRKLGREPLPPEVSPGMIGPAKTPAPEQPQQPLDFSGFEQPADEQPKGPLDFSGFDDPEAPKPAPADPNKHWAITRGFVTGMLKENPEGLAETLEGMGHLSPEFKESLHGASKEVRDLSKLSPAEYARKSGSMWDIRSLDDALSWAGETLGQGLASSVPSLATGTAGAVIGGRVGGKTGAVVGGTAGAAVPSAVLNYGEVYKALKDEKIEPEKAAEYAAYAVGPITALDVASLGPIIGRLGGVKEVQSMMARAFAKRIAAEAAKGAGREGITEALQDLIEKFTVSTAANKDFLTPETFKSALENAAGGALVGGAMGGVTGIKPDVEAAAPAPAPAVGPGAPGGALPGGAGPAGPGAAAPGAGPTAGPSSPEDIADFVRRAQEANPPQQPTGPARPQDPATMDDAQLAEAFQQARADMGDKSLRDILRAGGYADSTIDNMDQRGQVEEAIGIARAYKYEAEREKAPFEPEVKTEGPQQEGLKPKAPADHREYATLREYGYSDEDIGNMSPAQRKREVSDAIAEGIKPEEAMTKHAMPAPEAPQASVSETPPSPTAGTRAEPVDIKTAADIETVTKPASGDYTHAQGEANNRQLGHGKWQGLPVSIEVAKGGTRKMVNPKTGEPVEVTHGAAAYGYFPGTVGADKMHVDFSLGDHPESPDVWVIDEKDRDTGKFRQHKVQGGFLTEQEAVNAYAQISTKGHDTVLGVTHMTVPELTKWLREGDTTKPLAKAPAAPNASEGMGAAARPLTEAGAGTSVAVPKVGPAPGAEAETTGPTITTGPGGSKQASEAAQEVIPPGRLMAEATDEHHAQIEAVLGEDYHRVAEVDINRAAEIMAETGAPAQIAFGQAVVENAVDQGFLTEQEAVEAYGEDVKDVLEPVGEGTPERGQDTGGPRAQSEQVGAGGAEETGVVPGGSEAGEQVAAAEAAAAADETANAEQPDTGRTVANAERETSGEPAQEAADTTKDANEPVVTTTGGGTKKRGTGVKTASSVLDEEEGPTLTDVGEKLGRARKDMYGSGGLTIANLLGMSEKEKNSISKTQVWGRPDYVSLVEEANVEPIAAALIKRLYDRIPANPKTTKWYHEYTDEAAEKFVEALTKVRDIFGNLKTRADVQSVGRTIDKEVGWKLQQAIEPKAARYGIFHVSGDDLRAAERAVAAGFPKMAAWQRLFEVRKRDHWPSQKEKDAYAKYRDEIAIGFFKDNDISLDVTYGRAGGVSADRLRLRKWGTDSDVEANYIDPETLTGKLAEVWQDLNDLLKKSVIRPEWIVQRKNGAVVSIHETREQAEAGAAAAYDKLKDKSEGPQEPERPHLDQVERTGPDYRKGKNIGADDFMKEFGFRGVEFGNWAASDERQKVVNLAYDAFHDLARALKLPPKAMSLNGTLGIGFGSRGKGGKNAAAAHYEPDLDVINMTKIHGAGTLAHEWGHALDYFLGRIGVKSVGENTSLSGGRITPRDTEHHWKRYGYRDANRNLPPKLQQAANRLMHTLFNTEETDEANRERLLKEIRDGEKTQENWRNVVKRGRGTRGYAQAQTQVRVWENHLENLRQEYENNKRKSLPSEFLKQATRLSGGGDYWRRPTEMVARSFESFVFDRIKAEGFSSQYLVHGVEGGRFGTDGFKGNPYPTGDERIAMNKAYDRLLDALELEGGERIQAKQGEPEPIEEVVRPKRDRLPRPGEAKAEIEAVTEGEENTLSNRFMQYFINGGTFRTILEARKFANDAGYQLDAKGVEEAIEFGVVKAARNTIQGLDPADAYKALVRLYDRQPILGTRTSTSVRDQAYSTPVPLAYLAGKLAQISPKNTVYEPTAGNGALLLAANPAFSYANEINPERANNLRQQKFYVFQNDASAPGKHEVKYDRVIGNPPFGTVRTEDGSQIKEFNLKDSLGGVNYVTDQVDRVIMLRALDAMKDDGKATFIIGGISKMVKSPEDRAAAYNGKGRREFFHALYNAYNVTDHFTVSGDLYGRQGAAWPVDVIVIEGRGKSALPLPAVRPPRIYDSWDALGGLLNGQPSAGSVQHDVGAAGGAAQQRPGLEGDGGRDRGGAGRQPDRSGEPEAVRGESGPGAAAAGPASGVTGNEPGGRGADQEPARSGAQPAVEDDLDALLQAALDDTFGPAETASAETPKPRETASQPKPGPKADTRTTAEVAKEAGKAGVEAADEAFSALYKMFGSGKFVGTMGAFDEESYQKAKPHFQAAAEKFAEFKSNLGELLKRMMAHLRDTMKFTREAMEAVLPYLKRFIEDMRAAEKPAEPKAEALKPEPIETENQVAYVAQSKVPGLGTLGPVNLNKPMKDSLDRLETRVGPIDQFVAKELAYKPQELGKYFGAEQVDALGLAIDNIKNGSGFIIGDQTGIGKGRVNAAIIKWAILNNRIPMFVTMTPMLYKDIVRDMEGIGMLKGGFFKNDTPRLLATNANLDLPLDDVGNLKIKNGDPKAHDKHLMDVVDNFKKHYDVVLTNYSQMQTLKGEDTTRRAFMQALTSLPGGVVIAFDESHNAGGQGKQRQKKKNEAGAGIVDRAAFTRGLIQSANGVFYSSATYAKRPDVMDLYSATNMTKAVDNLDDLAEAINKGRVPMQQAVASMLAKDGQYVRRERSFAGINYNTPKVPVNRESYDQISLGLKAIQVLSQYVKKVTASLSSELAAQGEVFAGDTSTGDAGAVSTNFTSVMHNVVNQMLLAMKAEQAASVAIEAIKRGEKPVLTVANTMESFMTDYADTAAKPDGSIGLAPGDKIDADFSDVLVKYLDRSRTVLIKEPNAGKKAKPKRHYLTDEELGPEGVQLYSRAKSIIQSLDLSGLPVSPIDYIKGKIEAAGYRVGEITGRTLTIDYGGGKGNAPVLSQRPGSERTTKGKNKTIKEFNTKAKNGGTHALVINQSGSTGLSMHSSETFDDQSKRHMFIVQAEANIDTHMQLLGRVNRTGQVVLPEYTQLNADIPAETRPAAVLTKKMASLNANTTASRSSAVTDKETPDLMNEYGDLVAISFLRDHPELNHELGDPVHRDEEGNFKKDDAMRKLTGRLTFLRIGEQERIWKELIDEYNSMIEQLDAAGENALEAKSFDLKARLLERSIVQGERDGSGSAFAAPVVMQKVSIARLGKPWKPSDIMEKLAAHFGAALPEETTTSLDRMANVLAQFGDPYSVWGKNVSNEFKAIRVVTLDKMKAYTSAVVDDMEDAEAQTKQNDRLRNNRDRWLEVFDGFQIGARVVLKFDSGNLNGIVLKVEQKGTPKNPMALGSWKVTVAVPDASRQLTLPFSRLFPEGKADPNSSMDVEFTRMTDWYEKPRATLERFEHMQHEAREERYILGGNILAAYDWMNHKGAIINYTSENGSVHQGILAPRGFQPAKQAAVKGRTERDPLKLIAFMKENPSFKMESKNGAVVIAREGRWSTYYFINVPKAKGKGGVYYTDKALTQITGDFSSKGNTMQAYVPESSLPQAIARMQQIGAQFSLPAEQAGVEKGWPKGQEPQLAAGGNALEPRLSPAEIERVKELVRKAVRDMVGNAVEVEFDNNIEMTPEAMEKWGGTQMGAIAAYYPSLIKFALDARLPTTVPHEVYHAVEYQLQTPVERELMQRETPRIRRLIRDYAKAKYQVNDEGLANLAGEEVRAIGMEAFASGKLGGAHIGVRRWYQKLMDFIRKLGNWLRGLGYQSAEDIYGKVKAGFYAGVQGITPRQEVAGQLAAIRPGGARPGPVPQSETISEQLRDAGHDAIAGLATRLGVGRFNTTEARTLLQDKFIRVKRAEESVGGVPSVLSAYQAESLYYGRTGERLERLDKDRIEPIIKALHDADISYAEIGEYLYARHAPARNAYIDTINPGMGGEGSGMSDADAAAILNAITASGQMPAYRRIEAMIRRMQAETLDNLVSYGLISQETRDQWEATYPDGTYVPLQGFAEGFDDDQNFGGHPRGYDTRGKESKQAFGRRSEADNPLQFIIYQAMRAIVRGEKNRVGNTFLRFVRANPDPDRWQVNAPTLKRRIDGRTGLVTYYTDFNYWNEPDAVVTKMGGKPIVIRLYGKDGMNIARAFKAMGSSTLHPVVQVMHTLTTLQSRLSTQWNPNFTIPNLIRDLGEAFMNLQEQDQRRFVQLFAGHIGPSIKGSFRALTGAPAGDRYVNAFREFDRVGGRVHFFGLTDPDDIRKKINSTLRRLEGGTFATVENFARAAGNAFDVVNGSIENATRLAAYMAARDVGMSAPDAAMLARNLTVDFNKRGEWGQAINALYNFGTASIQGTARMGRALMHKRVRQAAYTLVAMGAVGALYNMLGGGDDDDGTPYYAKIKPYIRDKNLIIMWPKGFGRDGKYIKLPLPYGFAPFHVIGDRAAGFALGKDKLGQAAHSIAASVADAFNPLGEESSLWMMFVPGIIRPGIHIAVNKNWTGAPIYPEHDYDKTKPASTKSFRSTSDFSKWTASTMNELTGGSQYKSGWLDVHPGSIDHVLETISGGLGKFVMDVVKTGGSIIKGEPFDETRAPIIRRFLGSAKDPVTDAQAYYEAREEARKGSGENLRAARKDLASGKNKEAAESFIRENPNAAKAGEIFKQADERMKPLRAQRDRIEQSKELSWTERRQQLDEVTEKMRQIQNAARKRYRELKEGARP